MCAAAALFLALAPIQDPAPPGEPGGQLAAVWDGGSVSFERFDRFLGATMRGKPTGQEAMEHVLQIRVVEWEADRLGFTAPAGEVDARVAQARAAVESQGLDFEGILADRNLSLEEFRDLLRLSLLHELVVEAGREDPGGGTPTRAELEAWSRERIDGLIADQRAPGPGLVLESGGFQVTEIELGRAIRRALPHPRLQEHLQQLAVEDWLEAWSTRAGLGLPHEEIEAELAWRRKRVAENPAFGGATYEQLLEAQNSSVEAVRQGRELRAAALLRMYARRHYDEAWFDALSAESRQALELEHGAARHTAWLLLRSMEKTVDPLELTHEQARTELAGYAGQISSAAEFLAAAGRFSEHEPTRRRNGEIGWVHRMEDGVDAAVCAAAFAAEPGTVYGPVAVRDGQALVFVLEERPGPTGEEFREAVRRALHTELRQSILAAAGLRTVYGG